MNRTLKKPLQRIGYDFIEAPYLPEGKDEYYIRDRQFGDGTGFRQLTAYEIEVLVKNENQSGDWTDIEVSDTFDPRLVKRCQFFGRIRIGALQPYFLEYHELKLPVGLYNSTIISCDIGDNVVINNVDYLAYYIIGKEVILFNINEMHNTNHSKFGNGILKDGEDEEVRVWLEICNENGGRKVLPFEGMTPADAWLWAKFRDNPALMDRLREMTEARFDSRRGYYGTVGDRSVIKNTRILKDVNVGSDAYIKGGNKLKNLTINSSAEAPSQIGEGVEMVNGIMGYGSRAFYGVKAVRFVMGENTTLKYGARLINSFLGDNSTISCCEVLNSLIFPAHEQHHNNSFLVAATVMGQSNIAAGATIGSNHNSRGADGEIVAGRGFWPALSLSLKHNSMFASFCLVAKGSYAYELNIPFPFALVSQSESDNCLHIMPAYWWLYNMYALARNAWKYTHRDQRIHKIQPLVSDFLAPDTVSEMFDGLRLLEVLTARAFLKTNPQPAAAHEDLAGLGARLLAEGAPETRKLSIHGEGMEYSTREVRILKAVEAYRAYREMIHHYCIKALIEYGETASCKGWEQLKEVLSSSRRCDWVNLGGQLARASDVDILIQKIQNRQIDSWDSLHDAYQRLHEQYSQLNAANAYASLLELHGLPEEAVTAAIWKQWLEQSVEIARLISNRTRESRQKDYDNPFRQATYDSAEEMQAVLGIIDDNSFIREMEAQAGRFEEKVKRMMC